MATKKLSVVAEPLSAKSTLAELSAALRHRDLSATIYTLNDGYAVWAFAADDPALGIFPGEGPELEDALSNALAAWDNAEIAEEEPGADEEPAESN